MRETGATWKQKYLQQGISGTAVVFDNARTGAAMTSFPPSDEVLQETLVAVFTGPEDRRQEAMGTAERDRLAREALRREVGLMVNKAQFDAQAHFLQSSNYVYAKADYREELVAKFDASPAVPACFESCARGAAGARWCSP